MKKIFLSVLSSFMMLSLYSQIQFDVPEIRISKLSTNSSKTSVHDYNIPYIEGLLSITNMTDSTIDINVNDINLSLQYWFENSKHSIDILYYTVLDHKNQPINDRNIRLVIGEMILIETYCYLADVGTSLFLRFTECDDNTLNALRILPTVKYALQIENISMENNHIYNIIIKDNVSD